ncbi:transposase [Vampirovibrio sp.]
MWKRKYGGLNVSEVRRLREMEQENTQLKRIVANLMLENEAIKEVLKKL